VDAGTDPEGLVGARGWVKMNFSLQMGVFLVNSERVVQAKVLEILKDDKLWGTYNLHYLQLQILGHLSTLSPVSPVNDAPD